MIIENVQKKEHPTIVNGHFKPPKKRIPTQKQDIWSSLENFKVSSTNPLHIMKNKCSSETFIFSSFPQTAIRNLKKSSSNITWTLEIFILSSPGDSRVDISW